MMDYNRSSNKNILYNIILYRIVSYCLGAPACILPGSACLGAPAWERLPGSTCLGAPAWECLPGSACLGLPASPPSRQPCLPACRPVSPACRADPPPLNVFFVKGIGSAQQTQCPFFLNNNRRRFFFWGGGGSHGTEQQQGAAGKDTRQFVRTQKRRNPQ